MKTNLKQLKGKRLIYYKNAERQWGLRKGSVSENENLRTLSPYITQISLHNYFMLLSFCKRPTFSAPPGLCGRDYTYGPLNSKVTIPGPQMCQISKWKKLSLAAIRRAHLGRISHERGGGSLASGWFQWTRAKGSFQRKGVRTEKPKRCQPYSPNLKGEDINQSSGRIRNSLPV